MDDLISRKAAIEIASGFCHPANIAKELAKLPSAQPEKRTEERTETHACDYVSRQAAIDAMEDVDWHHINSNGQLVHGANSKEDEPLYKAEDVYKVLNDMPSAQPEPSQVARDIATIIENEKDMRVIAAQPEPIRINLNEPIKVKLTDWGKKIYYHQYDRTNQIAGREICKPRFPREDENGYTEFQLWCFIELYGMHMGMTLPNVIEPLEIVYER